MELIFDVLKDSANLLKHGISLVDANLLEWDTLFTKSDTRHDYGEIRSIGYAFIGTRLYCVIFTDRDTDRRVISLRKANQREVKYYVDNY
jgi:uncharacterized DUF497 family protein